MQTDRMGLGALVLAAALSGGCESFPYTKGNPASADVVVRIPDAVAAAKAFDPLALNKLVEGYVNALNEKGKQSQPPAPQPADIHSPPSQPLIIFAAMGNGNLEGTIKVIREKDKLERFYNQGQFPKIDLEGSRIEENMYDARQAGFGRVWITSPMAAVGNYRIEVELGKVSKEQNIGYIVVLARRINGEILPSVRRFLSAHQGNPLPIEYTLETQPTGPEDAEVKVNSEREKAHDEYNKILNSFEQQRAERRKLFELRQVKGDGDAELKTQIVACDQSMDNAGNQLHHLLNRYPLLIPYFNDYVDKRDNTHWDHVTVGQAKGQQRILKNYTKK